MINNFTELSRLDTFDERFEYLKLDGSIGFDTFGFDRHLNQTFYHSDTWKRIRDSVIVRDCGCDLGLEGCEIHGKILVHHMNPVTIQDILERNKTILDPEFLVCVSHQTHNAIHYGSKENLARITNERLPNDTCPWRH